MKKSIIIRQSEKMNILIIDEIYDHQLFQLVNCIEKTLHQSAAKQLTDEDLTALAKKELKIDLEPTKLIAEININKQIQDF